MRNAVVLTLLGKTALQLGARERGSPVFSLAVLVWSGISISLSYESGDGVDFV